MPSVPGANAVPRRKSNDLTTSLMRQTVLTPMPVSCRPHTNQFTSPRWENPASSATVKAPVDPMPRARIVTSKARTAVVVCPGRPTTAPCAARSNTGNDPAPFPCLTVSEGRRHSVRIAAEPLPCRSRLNLIRAVDVAFRECNTNGLADSSGQPYLQGVHVFPCHPNPSNSPMRSRLSRFFARKN